MMRKGIWFGKLADGTEASVSDLILQDLTVVQAARVRIDQTPLDYTQTLEAAQYLRQRYPELNREQQASPCTEAGFSRKNLPEEEAARAVQLHVAPQSSNRVKCQQEALSLMNRHVARHPTSFSRLGWRIDILHSVVESDDVYVVWLIFSVSHTHVDGVAMQVILTDYLEAYASLLRGQSLPLRVRLPLYSSLPRDRLPLTWGQQIKNGFAGWLACKFLGQPGAPAPKLLTEEAMQDAQRSQKERLKQGRDQREGPLHADFVELPEGDTNNLRAHAKSIGLAVGSLVHAALFMALAKRYFQEHPEKDALELAVPLSMNLRPYLQPSLPNTVLAPQQGEVMVRLKTTSREIDLAMGGGKKTVIPTLHKIALASRTQVQAAMAQPQKLKPVESSILLASLLRKAGDTLGAVQYVGDAWLSNVGLYRPSDKMKQALTVETTLTLIPTILPAYELVCCNSTLGGSMALSIVTDETMGRTQASAKALLQETIKFLRILLD